MDDPIIEIELVGQYLRRKREEKRISLDEVSLQTRIQPVFLQAIEDGRFDKIASMVSIKGFVRSYARFLKIDEVEVLKRLSEYLSSVSSVASLSAPVSSGSPKTEPAPAQTLLFPLGPTLRSGDAASNDLILNMGTVGEKTRKMTSYSQWVGGSAIVLIGLFLFQLYAPREGNKGELSSPVQIRVETRPAGDAPSPINTVDDVPAVDAPTVDTPSAQQASETPTPNATPKPFLLSLEAREPTWVKVLVDGKGTKDVLLLTGEKVVWQADKTFLLTMGNAGGAEVSLDGKDLGFLGKKGEILRDRLLTRVASEQTTTNND